MKSGWLRRIRSAAAMLALAAGVWAQGAGAAEPEVKNVTAAFLWPWTNAVGISFEVTGTVPTNAELIVTAKDVTRNATYPVFGLSGDTGTNEGVHHVVWGLHQQGVKIQSTNVVFTVSYGTNACHLYCVVDLSGGTNTSMYPVSYMDAPPSGGFNTDEYKTTKLVLRRIEAGTFTMGSPSDEDPQAHIRETQHKVTLTKPFYMGVFEVTQRQWELAMGNRPSYFSNSTCYAARPVEQVSYSDIRGDSAGAGWPATDAVDATSFLGVLRAKTGLAFDLPTDAQWEYACRAGTTTAFNSGKDMTSNGHCANLAALGRYKYNGREFESLEEEAMWDTTGGTAAVGSYEPNAWGLYDMHGNVNELCLDWFNHDLGPAAVTDPKGASSGYWNSRVSRGGSWSSFAWQCRSAYRSDGASPSEAGCDGGFRLSRILSE